MNKKQNWPAMTILSLSGGIIFMLPFLREVYYIPMQQALGFHNTQMGALMSVFGTVSFVSYFPGGWIADRFAPGKLICLALIISGISGLYFATYPSYQESLIIHGIWGGCSVTGFLGCNG